MQRWRVVGKGEVKQLSEMHRERCKWMFAKLVTLGERERAAGITFDLGTLRQVDHGTRRVGRPRATWYQTTIADMWEEVKRTGMGMRYAGEMDLSRQ